MSQTENLAVNKTTINVITKYLDNKNFCPQHVCIARINNEIWCCISREGNLRGGHRVCGLQDKDLSMVRGHIMIKPIPHQHATTTILNHGSIWTPQPPERLQHTQTCTPDNLSCLISLPGRPMNSFLSFCFTEYITYPWIRRQSSDDFFITNSIWTLYG